MDIRISTEHDEIHLTPNEPLAQMRLSVKDAGELIGALKAAIEHCEAPEWSVTTPVSSWYRASEFPEARMRKEECICERHLKPSGSVHNARCPKYIREEGCICENWYLAQMSDASLPSHRAQCPLGQCCKIVRGHHAAGCVNYQCICGPVVTSMGKHEGNCGKNTDAP